IPTSRGAADVVGLCARRGRPAVERVEQIDRDEHVFPDFTLGASIELNALATPVGEACVVLGADVYVRARAIVRVVRRSEREEALQVLSRIRIYVTLVVGRK